MITNNLLYKDVHNNTNNVNLNVSDIVRSQHPIVDDNQEIVLVSDKIEPSSKIKRASCYQGDSIFGESAGVQCAAMAMGCIIHKKIINPNQWTTNILNNILIESNDLYQMVVDLLGETIPTNGYLNVQSFNCIKHDILMYRSFFKLDYSEEPEIYGNLKYNLNIGSCGGINLNLVF